MTTALMVVTTALMVVTGVGGRLRPVVVVRTFVGMIGGGLRPGGGVLMGRLMLVVVLDRAHFGVDVARDVLMTGDAVEYGAVGLFVGVPRGAGGEGVGPVVGRVGGVVAVAGLILVALGGGDLVTVVGMSGALVVVAGRCGHLTVSVAVPA
ncbi:MAG: hypothetical protein ACRD0C_18725, partial [Acidimicrobiia bacterium]